MLEMDRIWSRHIRVVLIYTGIQSQVAHFDHQTEMRFCLQLLILLISSMILIYVTVIRPQLGLTWRK